jgi:hypothetical protein
MMQESAALKQPKMEQSEAEKPKVEAPITANETENPYEIVKGLLREAVIGLDLDEGVYRLLEFGEYMLTSS